MVYKCDISTIKPQVMAYILMLCPIKKMPTAQTAHLVFADTKANEKNQKSCFFANARKETHWNFGILQ